MVSVATLFFGSAKNRTMTSQRSVVGRGSSEVGADGDVTTRIVTAVAEREGVEPTALDTRLYEAIDPDALTRLIENAPDTGLTVGFDYAGYRVTVVADGTTHVEVAEKP
ncbi:hypothetical protein SY89_03394 [Halolamina pelagica]|uniref:Halobacterial output domain-containing protein n=2 Tax=Halolamina pelagica TaxID=699431 RepID=A0A0P7HR68_9EURY|nr:hypothetical protein SY89_03394 [Halolamina pelagica]